MTRPTKYLSTVAVAITILGSACGLEESHIPPPKKSTAIEPVQEAPDPVAVFEPNEWSVQHGNANKGNAPAERVADPIEPDLTGDTVRNDVRRPDLFPRNRHGPRTAEESQKLIGRLRGRVKLDLKSGNVVVVWLNRTNVDDYDLQLLENLSDIQVLNLTGTRVTDRGLVHLQGLKKLRRIYPQGTRITEEGLQTLKAKLPELRVMMNRSGVPNQ